MKRLLPRKHTKKRIFLYLERTWIAKRSLLKRTCNLRKSNSDELSWTFGGTGNFDRALLDSVKDSSAKKQLKIVVVEPYMDPSTPLSSNTDISFVKAPAEDFLNDPDTGDPSSEWRRQG
jgi:hypothetical protein